MRLSLLLPLMISFCIFLFSCNNNTNKNKISSKQKIVKELDPKSEYQILVWANYKIEERNGPDFTVYYFYPADTTEKLFGTGGFYFGGHPQRIKPDGDKKLIKDSIVYGNLLGNKINWTIFDYGASIFVETILELGDYDKVSAFAYGRSYSDIDSLINVLESLRLKK